MFIKRSIIGFIMMGAITTSFALAPFEPNTKTPVQEFSQAGVADSPKPAVKAAFAVTGKVARQKARADIAFTQAKAKSMQADIDTINRTNVIYRQSVDTRIASLNSEVQAMQSHMKKLNQAVLLLNQAVLKLSERHVAVGHETNSLLAGANAIKSDNSLSAWVQSTKNQLGDLGFYGILGLLLVALIIAIWAFSPKSRKQNHLNQSVSKDDESDVDDTEGEYDYMGSDESIPAKLNLARAYIAMEDFAAAKKAIEEVLAYGNSAQCEEAQSLNAKIPGANAG